MSVDRKLFSVIAELQGGLLAGQTVKFTCSLGKIERISADVENDFKDGDNYIKINGNSSVYFLNSQYLFMYGNKKFEVLEGRRAHNYDFAIAQNVVLKKHRHLDIKVNLFIVNDQVPAFSRKSEEIKSLTIGADFEDMDEEEKDAYYEERRKKREERESKRNNKSGTTRGGTRGRGTRGGGVSRGGSKQSVTEGRDIQFDFSKVVQSDEEDDSDQHVDSEETTNDTSTSSHAELIDDYIVEDEHVEEAKFAKKIDAVKEMKEDKKPTETESSYDEDDEVEIKIDDEYIKKLNNDMLINVSKEGYEQLAVTSKVVFKQKYVQKVDSIAPFEKFIF